MKRLIQELYDQVGGALFFKLEYARKMTFHCQTENHYTAWLTEYMKKWTRSNRHDPTKIYMMMTMTKADEDLRAQNSLANVTFNFTRLIRFAAYIRT